MSSVHQNSLNQVTSLVAALQHYVAANTSAGLTDVSSAIEVLVSEVLHITEGLSLTRLNLLKPNFPAIDLADPKRGVAIQVTSNVTSAKCKETIEKFDSNSMGATYAELRILGFCKATTPHFLPSYAIVQGPAALLSPLKNLDISQLRKLEKMLRESYDFSKLSPLQDADCFRVVLSVLDRDAVRHFTSVEGSYADLASALKEVKEIITAGCIPAKNIYAKPLSQYSSKYEDVLRDIDLHLGQMLAEVNRARRDSHYCLTYEQKRKIDNERSEIIQKVNDFCRGQGINHQIHGIW
ncbi:MAG: SMEK domain-containing protein [Lysobacter sp.]|nr:SMEK domain-containing protein [Lysobacter sp.]